MNDTPPRPVNPPPARTDDANETAARGVEATGSQAVALPGAAGRPTVAGARGPAPSGTAVLQHIGDYVVVRKIGEGGMGAVYLAEDTKLGRKVAIKTMKLELSATPANRARFLREAQAAAAIDHDNVVPIWHIGEAADGTPFIAMPFLQGEMLDDRLKRDRVCNLGILVKVAREVADGLAAAHAKGLIHRDIKPGNIWLEGDLTSKELAQQIRRCKVLDFGLARSVDKEDVQITASGAILGTPAYMAPEQARAEKVDHRADLWSLGVMLYRMAAGRLPFRGPNAMAVLIALTTETPPPVRTLNPNLPPALADLIDQLMSKDPAGRPQSAAEVSAAVRQIVKDVQAKKSPAVPAPAASSSQPVPVYLLPAPAPNAWEDVTEADAEGAPIAKVPAAAKRGRAPWYVAGGVLGLLALVAVLAVVIIRVQTAEGTLVVEITDPDVEARIKNGKLVLVGADGKEKYTITSADRNKTIDAGQYSIRVEGADGLALNTSEFTLRKNGQVTVRVTLDPKLAKKADPKKDVPNLEADRKAAEYVLSVGGSVKLNGEDRDIKAAADLPKGRYTLTGVDLARNTAVTDAGMAHFKDCTNLTVLYLYRTPVTDAGLTHLQNCKALEQVSLGETKVTDAGMATFKDHTRLTGLFLNGTRVTDAGLMNFKNCREFRSLDLSNPQLTDAGLAEFKGCKMLTSLSIYGTQVTDVGLDTINDCKGLTDLDVRKTKVTEKRAKELHAAVPGCKVEYEGGTIAAIDVDRKAAEWVLSIGGTVCVNGEESDIKDAKDLPKEAFRLTLVNLMQNKHATDAGLVVFAGCKNLTSLNLGMTSVTDVGLAHFKQCKTLKYLALYWTAVTDAGMVHFKDCQNLTALWVDNTVIGDAGLAHFKGINPTELSLWNTRVTDAGLAQFEGCTDLSILFLAGTRVTDAGLARFRNCKIITRMYLAEARITDAGLAHFKDCKSLTILFLSQTGVSDAAAEHLKGCTDLTSLDVRQTKFTAKGVAVLAKALPGCEIRWDGGVIESTLITDADRKLAEHVLSVGGVVRVNGEHTDIKAAKDLPKTPFRLPYVSFRENKSIDDKALGGLKDCERLTLLDLKDTQVSDAGLGVFKGCKNLRTLDLAGTRVTDKGLANFKECKNIGMLGLADTGVTDEGLALFTDSKSLVIVYLQNTRFSDNGLALLARCRSLKLLHVDGTQVTDVGLAALRNCNGLSNLTIHKTKVTPEGLAEFAKALPSCRIEWDGGVIEPTKK